MVDKEGIGKRIKQLRIKSNMTQVQLAETCGLTVRTIGKIERGETNMNIQTFVRICDALDVLPNDIAWD